MRAVVQRVTRADVTVEDEVTGAVKDGLVVFVGVEEGDTQTDLSYIVDKVAGLRIFEDDNDKMNRSVLDVGGRVLWISQFTLLGDARKGRRPSFSMAASPDIARSMYEQGGKMLEEKGISVACGRFQEHMHVNLLNDGPVTILLDSRRKF
jgi:D-tyrosyl-tRNA(Tyr) deacylase